MRLTMHAYAARLRSRGDGGRPSPTATVGPTAQERAQAVHRELRAELAGDVLDRVRRQSVDFLEQVVHDVMGALSYGGCREDPANWLERGEDGGLFGVVRENQLGLDLIYVEAGRAAAPVGRRLVEDFVAALNDRRASKGVLLTTSTFTSEAAAYAEQVTPRIVLVDGPQLAELMLDHDLGVRVAARYEIKRIDLEYFSGQAGRPAAAVAAVSAPKAALLAEAPAAPSAPRVAAAAAALPAASTPPPAPPAPPGRPGAPGRRSVGTLGRTTGRQGLAGAG